MFVIIALLSVRKQTDHRSIACVKYIILRDNKSSAALWRQYRLTEGRGRSCKLRAWNGISNAWSGFPEKWSARSPGLINKVLYRPKSFLCFICLPKAALCFICLPKAAVENFFWPASVWKPGKLKIQNREFANYVSEHKKRTLISINIPKKCTLHISGVIFELSVRIIYYL